MNMRKTLREKQNVRDRRMSSNMYPKGDFKEIADKLTKAGFEPFGNIRERGLSSNDCASFISGFWCSHERVRKGPSPPHEGWVSNLDEDEANKFGFIECNLDHSKNL